MCVRETQNRRGCFESPVVPASDIYYASVLERVGSSQAAGVSEVISLCGFYLAIQKLHWSYFVNTLLARGDSHPILMARAHWVLASVISSL
jgi:hypothetical protein